MISFNEFYLLEIHSITNRMGQPRTRKDGTVYNTGTNLVANNKKVGDHNHDQNKTQEVGIIPNAKAEKYIQDYNLNRNKLNVPTRLGKRPFTIQKTETGFVINRI